VRRVKNGTPSTQRLDSGLLARLRGYCRDGRADTRLDITINAKRQVADAAARAEAKGVVERLNEQIAASRDMPYGLTCSAQR
jgi:hypothetical protein